MCHYTRLKPANFRDDTGTGNVIGYLPKVNKVQDSISSNTKKLGVKYQFGTPYQIKLGVEVPLGRWLQKEEKFKVNLCYIASS